ncbi:Shedu immune nuclease family protein [Halomonas sp.]|uniref:Shedu immune nuclease family protein n=1 Tax=Halomonas sp. TaxID=1486246 RepID=UPI003D0E7DB7
MIYFGEDGNTLLLSYVPERWNGARWLDEKLKQQIGVTLRRTFTFTIKDLFSEESEEDDDDDEVRTFVLGSVEEDYNRINKDVLGLKHDLLIEHSIRLHTKIFIAHRDISIFRKIDSLIDEPIIVGGDAEGAIPLEDFESLLKTFPTSTELNHYAHSRISRVLKDYFGTLSDAEEKLKRHLAKKETLEALHGKSFLADFELKKFEYIHDELISMLDTADSYAEKDWQTKILGLLLFVFPKFITVLENVHIKDFYSNVDKATNRYIDLMLVDANGSIDIIEIKRPRINSLLSRKKYRNNYTPRGELSDTVMQAEKYLFHLSKWGRAGEKEISQKRKSELPDGIELKITNPKAIILLGRDSDFTDEQRFDFEIIRRKYANMLDIMTYDDLLRRLENIIVMMKRQVPAGNEK